MQYGLFTYLLFCAEAGKPGPYVPIEVSALRFFQDASKIIWKGDHVKSDKRPKALI